MNCPIDNTQLVLSERQGIEIDYCPQCRGIWLDRGELDKLIERSNGGGAPAQHQQPVQYSSHDDHKHNDDYKRHDDDHHNDYNGKPRKKESLLSDLFDF